MKKYIAFLILLILIPARQTFGQLAVGYGTDGNTLSLSTDPRHVLCGEFRVNTKAYNQSDWSHSDRGITQAYLLVRIFSSTNASLYTGAGIGVNLLTEGSEKWVSANIPVGLRINPFEKLPNLFIVGEYTPMIIIEEDVPIIHAVSIGFRYRLSKSE
jgi:hypothetical protein